MSAWRDGAARRIEVELACTARRRCSAKRSARRLKARSSAPATCSFAMPWTSPSSRLATLPWLASRSLAACAVAALHVPALGSRVAAWSRCRQLSVRRVEDELTREPSTSVFAVALRDPAPVPTLTRGGSP